MDQGVYNTNKTINLLEVYGYNIVSNNGIYESLDPAKSIKKHIKKSKINSVKLEINDPVVYIDYKDDTKKIGHFAGYDVNDAYYVYELGGTSYTRGAQQVIKCKFISPLTERDTQTNNYVKQSDIYDTLDGVVVDKDTLNFVTIENVIPEQHNHNIKLHGAQVINCELKRTSFINVDLTGSKLSNVILDGTTLSDVSLKNMNIAEKLSYVRENLLIDGHHIDTITLCKK